MTADLSTPGKPVGVIFDLDGTLADTLDDIAAAMNHVLAERGLPGHDRERYRRFVGEGARRLVERALPADRLALVDEALAAFRAYYREHQVDLTRPYPGVAELLDGLSRRGVPVAVLSNKPDRATRELVADLFQRWSFVEVAGERPGVPLKPDPAAALAIARAAGIEPGRWVFVGDSGIDMRTARAAGMTPIGALWGFREREELLANGAAQVVERPEEVLAVVDGIGSGDR